MHKSIKIITAISVLMLNTTSMAARRFIVKYHEDAQYYTDNQSHKPLSKEASEKRAHHLSQAVHKAHKHKHKNNQARISHAIATGAHVVILDDHLDEVETAAFIAAAKKNPAIKYIEEDRVLKAASLPGDLPVQINPAWQWDMTTLGQFAPNLAWIGDNFFNAWKTLKNYGFIPGKDVVVAVIDTGYTPHPNIINNLQTLNGQSGVYGYQFISDCRVSGECTPDTHENKAEQLYQQDGLDTGNYIDEAFITKKHPECDIINDPKRSQCQIQESDWHGTHVTGTIIGNGYNSSNKTGIAGGAYGAKVVPVRVLGRGGAATITDTVNGMMWAAGFEVTNGDNTVVPLNPNPAHILNLSLGRTDSCSNTEQDAVNKIISKGVIIVVAAGNEADDVKNSSPANCRGVISVAAKGPTNKLAVYSNGGATTIAASGGYDTIEANNKQTIYSTIWSSLNAYQTEAEDGKGSWGWNPGTSMATPHVSAAAAILVSVLKAQNKTYTPQNISDILQKTATTYDNCNNANYEYTDGSYNTINVTNTNRCAAGGALDVDKAVQYILSTPSSDSDSDSDSGMLTGLLTILGAGAVGAGGICLFNHHKH